MAFGMITHCGPFRENIWDIVKDIKKSWLKKPDSKCFGDEKLARISLYEKWKSGMLYEERLREVNPMLLEYFQRKDTRAWKRLCKKKEKDMLLNALMHRITYG